MKIDEQNMTTVAYTKYHKLVVNRTWCKWCTNWLIHILFEKFVQQSFTARAKNTREQTANIYTEPRNTSNVRLVEIKKMNVVVASLWKRTETAQGSNWFKLGFLHVHTKPMQYNTRKILGVSFELRRGKVQAMHICHCRSQTFQNIRIPLCFSSCH